MKKIIMWLIMLTKRQLKKLSLYIIIVIMIVACGLIKHTADNYKVSIEIGIVNEDSGNVSKMVEKGLYSHSGIIKFVGYNDYDELLRAVQGSKVMGGYVFKDNFSNKILSNENSELIESVSTPNSMVASMSNEILFSFLMKEVSYEELVKDTVDTELFNDLSEEQIRESLRKYYDINISNGSTFSVDYNNKIDDYDRENVTIDIYDYISPIIVGVVGLMIFISGMCGTVNYYYDKKSGALSLLKQYQRQMVALIEIAIPVFIVAISGIGVLLVTGMEEYFVTAAAKYGIYGIIVIIYCYILKSIIRTKEVFISIIPVFILLSLIFCPVFVNISSIIPELSWVGKLLPLHYLYII